MAKLPLFVAKLAKALALDDELRMVEADPLRAIVATLVTMLALGNLKVPVTR
jgi:hypothetical protein